MPPLALADVGDLPSVVELLNDYSAVALFVERAQMAKHDFQLTEDNARAVAEICATLDGLPLAIELAAARMKLLTARDLQVRLTNRLNFLVSGARDLPKRQQTIRETIRWSYELLTDAEKRLFRSLSVFVNGFSMADAESLCARLNDSRLDCLEGVASLFDKSLLIRRGKSGDKSRFGMLETIREFGLEQLEASRESDTVKQSHAQLFLQLAEEAEANLLGKEQKAWLERLEEEHDNLRAALNWMDEVDAVEMSLRMVGALWRFWLMRGYFTEGRARVTRVLEADGTNALPAARAKALNGLGTLTQNQGDYMVAQRIFEDSLSINRALRDNAGIATSLINLGWIAVQKCDYREARSLSEEGLALHKAAGSQHGVVLALNNLAFIADYQGDYQRARELHSQSIKLRREGSDTRALAFSLIHLTRTLTTLGEYAEAERSIHEGLVHIKALGDKQGIGYALAAQGELLIAQGRWQEAIPLIERGIALWRGIRDRFGLNIGLSILVKAIIESNDITQAEVICREGLQLQRELRNQRNAAMWLGSLAEVALRQGKWKNAAKLFGGATALREKIDSRIPPKDFEIQEQNLAKLREDLGEDQFSAAWARGQAMTMEQWLEEEATNE